MQKFLLDLTPAGHGCRDRRPPARKVA